MNIEQLIAGVRELATKYPNAKYKSVNGACYYSKGIVENGPETCGCIFGQVLVPALGKEVFDVVESSDVFVPPIGYILIHHFEVLPFDKDGKRVDAFWWCRLVQKEQDLGATWSQAVSLADAKISL